MGDTMRPSELTTLLAILAAVVLIVAASTPPRGYPPVPGPLTVDEATTFILDTPVVVSGYLVGHGVRTYLCDAPGCAGLRLAVPGLEAVSTPRRALVAGVVTGSEIALLRLTDSRRTASL